MIETTVVMQGLLSSSAISGKRKVRHCNIRQLRLDFRATGEVDMTQAKRTGPREPSSRTPQDGKHGQASRALEKGKVATLSLGGKSFGARSATEFRRDIKSGELQVRTGLDIIEALKKSGFTGPEIFKLVVSKRSLERRQQKSERLSAEESDRALRLVRIHDHAMRVFGSEEKAHRWLRKPCRALDGAIPLDLLTSETGAHIVESELHAIDHGMFA